MVMKIIAPILFVAMAVIALTISVWAEQPSHADKPITVSFTHDGRTVHGLLWGKGVYGVVLSHGAVYDAASWAPLASDIARDGMVALALEEVEPDDILPLTPICVESMG